MSRLIDADELRQVLEVYSEKDSLGHTPLQLCDAMPTIDAVEVTRCRDCKWYVPYTMENKTYKMCRKAHLGSDDFFCADGERKENRNEID